MNRISDLFTRKKKDVLSIYLTAGFPGLKDTVRTCEVLERSGADMIEIGIPFSDPVADGPVIQASNQTAIEGGMTLQELFTQLAEIRQKVSLPIVLMGYFNPIYQYGVERFCKEAAVLGVDAAIIPDLPADEYVGKYKAIFEKNNLKNIFLFTPQTSDERIRFLDDNSEGFIYAVSSAAVTGGSIEFTQQRKNYLDRIKKLKLRNPVLLGFGISKRQDIAEVSEYVSGVIIGSAFIKALKSSENIESDVENFIRGLK